MLRATCKAGRLTLSPPGGNLSDATGPCFEKVRREDFELDVCGVYGVVIYNNVEYLILVTEAREVCSLEGHMVYMVTDVRIIPIDSKDNSLAVLLIRDFFSIPGLFYSDYPLYLRYRPVLNPAPAADSEFLFNSVPIRNYRKYSDMFVLRCIQGYVDSYRDFVLISRRSYLRAGTRYFSRGCDREGNWSNFVETEQILIGKNSYLQVRGSIPLRWSHYPSLKLNPPIRTFSDSDEYFRHSEELLKRKYTESIVYLNLIREKGTEEGLNTEFQNMLGRNQAVHFDFHAKIKRESIPLDFLDPNDFTRADGSRSQRILVRTNCIDCLDRTNAAQYIIGRKVFRQQLADLLGDQVGDLAKGYETAYRSIFVYNGDMLSKQYSGTPALSSHHITQRKEIFSILFDGVRSLKRYYINRVIHTRTQRGYDIVTGRKTRGPVFNPKNVILSGVWLYLTLLTLVYPSTSHFLVYSFFSIFVLSFFFLLPDFSLYDQETDESYCR